MSIEIYIGPMFAGKTTKLISMYNENKDSNKVVIDYNKELSINNLINHTTIKLEKAYKGPYLSLIQEKYKNILSKKYIYINECQFFPDLKTFVLKCLDQNINVYLYGLDGDYKQDLFGQTMELIPYCSYIEKIKGTCQKCTMDSIVSYRTTNDTEIYLPNNNIYIPLCFKCLKKN
tara:strand:+ start:502 stop:1026 length:525 start_codon:yes stop_codon:yes gene_type:complete